jgi:hypothetical protein
MRSIVVAGALALAFGSFQAHASTVPGDDGDHPSCPHCIPETRDVCFNLVCNYHFDEDKDGHHEHHVVKAVATFTKDVTEQGGEVVDREYDDEKNASLAIQFDDHAPDNWPAKHFTGLLGTRVYAETGPTPGERNSGHYAHSRLDLEGEHGLKSLEGECFIYTGFP